MRLELLTRRERISEECDGFMHSWIEPATGRCTCGAIVTLEDPMDNFCECGRCFNMSGQEVIPMAECRDHDDY